MLTPIPRTLGYSSNSNYHSRCAVNRAPLPRTFLTTLSRSWRASVWHQARRRLANFGVCGGGTRPSLVDLLLLSELLEGPGSHS